MRVEQKGIEVDQNSLTNQDLLQCNLEILWHLR
jgi:hypothetical protein